MILSPDAQGQIDPTITKGILDHLPLLPIDLLAISWFPNFKFYPPTTTRYVLLDFMEPHSDHPEYDKFWQWVAVNPPILTFRRELKHADKHSTLVPIEFPAYLPIPEPQSEQNFMARPLEVLYFWGYSHQCRPKLHGDIFYGMAQDGLDVVGHWDDLINAPKRNKMWISVHTPHWNRLAMNTVISFTAQSKVTVALPGNGLKTFRHSECINTLMACWRDGLAWSYPWTEENSIQLTPHFEYQDLRKALEGDLYQKYVACCLNMRNYYAPDYSKNYVEAEIRKVI